MYYRPKEKKRNPLVTFLLSILLLVMMGVLVVLLAMVTGYIDYERPNLAERFAPTPTPTRPAVLYVADGDAHFAEGKLKEAVAAYEEAIQRDPASDVPYIRQSRLLVYLRNTAKAVDRAAQAVVLNPTSPENLAYYCRALDWEARYGEALDACSCALELDPYYAEAQAFLAEIYADQGDWIPARTTAQQAIETDFQSMDAHHNMGYALEVQGRYGEAVDSYENAIRLQPNLGPLYVDAGRASYWLGDLAAAAEHFKQALKLSPTDPEAYNWLGLTYYTNGEYSLAIDAYEQSLGIGPNYVSSNPRGTSAWGSLALVYYTRQNFEQSIEYFPKAIELAETQFLRRAREVEVRAELQTLTGPESIPILKGRFDISTDQNELTYTARFQPVTYLSSLELDPEQSCTTSIVRSIQNETELIGPPQSLTATLAFSQATGAATLDLVSGNLLLDLQGLPQPKTTPYEIRVNFWPNRGDSVGYFQPDANHSAQINIQFEEKLTAPVEYYYEIGLAYAYLEPPLCQEAVPWLLKALDIDSSGFNPAWAGLRICPSANSPPTPIPTFTPPPTPLAGE
jgi:tetratricopeptide (TPR) repeat protein